VGREEELSLLVSELQQVEAEERCRLVTIVGEPGVGKSRLAAELLALVGERARIARGACLSYGEGITYWPIAQVLRELAEIRDEHTLEEVRARLPHRITQLLGLTEGTMTAEQAVEAVAEFLAAAEPDRLLVVLVDDIHWAEPALLDLLVRLPRLLGSARIAIVCLARPELIDHRPDWDVTVKLEPLGVAQVDALLENLDAPAGARVRIAQASAGNPLFAEELVAWAHEGGDMDALPTSLNALLGARLDRLEPTERDALERGAVEGELFHEAAVIELTDHPSRPAVPIGLDELTRKDMIRLAATSLAGEMFAYRFKHILVRDAAYRATTKKLRASLHERYAGWLEQRAGARVGEYHEILGYHLEQAYLYRAELGDRDEALAARAGRHLGAAGLRANDRADVRAAANLLRRATGLLPRDSVERLELMRHLAYAVDQTGLMREARTISQELYERATAIGERRLAAHGKSYATPHPFFDQYADSAAAAAAFEDVIATFAEFGDQAGLAGAKRRLALVYRSERGLAASAALLEEALVHADASGDMSTRRSVAYSLANDVSYGPMPVADAIPRLEALRASSGDDAVLEAAVGRHLSCLYAMAGRFDESRALEDEVAPVLDEAQVESLSWGSLGASTRAKRLMGDLAGAQQDLRTKWRVYPVEDGKTQRLAIAAAQLLARLYCEEGRWDEAEACLATIRREGHEGASLGAEALLASHYGNHEEAVTLARRSVERQEGSDVLISRAETLLVLAEVQRAAGMTEEADDATAKALSLLERKGDVTSAARLRGTPLAV
jgi:predicted ATPase